jgi:ATP-binding cassette, subfamily C (CFTR/MRP), member 1
MDSKTLALMKIDEEGVKAKLAKFKGDQKKKEEVTEIGRLFRDDEDEEEMHKAKISFKVLCETFEILGGLKVILFFAFTNLVSQLIRNFRSFYEKDFYMFDHDNQRSTVFGFCGNILMSSIFCLALEAVKNIYWEKKNNTVEDNMYSQLFNKIMDAPVNLFFDVTPVDKVVGRFHRSMHTFKDTIVHSLCWIIHNGCECIIRLSLFAAVSYYMSGLAFFVSLTLLYLMYCWRKTAKNFWRMEHKLHKEYNVSIYQTFHGNAIIRCFGQEQQFKEKKLLFTNMWSQKDLVHLSGHFWQELRSDMVQTVFFAASCFFVIYYKGTVSPVLLSTVFFNSLDLGWIGHTIWGVNWFLENMDSAVWALEMQKICPQEETKEKIEIDDKVWPMEGKIEFKDVELKYRPDTEIVLNKLSFVVQPGHKVGLCGRTGAGKSTISMAISRIVELFSGQIEIDGVDISKVDLHTLRSKITVIPQDPILFTGTIRFNLDPYN